MLDPSRYHLDWLSLPFLVAAAAVAAVLLYVAFMRGAPLLRASFVALGTLVITFLAGYAMVASTDDPALARSWYLLAVSPLPLATSGILLFDLALARRLAEHRWLMVAATAASLVMTVVAAGTDLVIGDIWATPAGLLYYHVGPLGPLFALLIALTISLGSAILWRCRAGEPSALRRRQLLGAILAFSTWAVGLLDLLLAYEIGWYPVSWFFLTVGALLALRSVVSDDLIHATSFDPRALLALAYLAAAGGGSWLCGLLAGGRAAAAAALFGLFVVLRGAYGLLRRRPPPGAPAAADSPLERALDRFVAAMQRVRTEGEIAAATDELLRLALGCEQVAFLVPSAVDYSWRHLGGDLLAEAATPDPRLLGWWLANAEPVQREAMLALRLGDLRPLVERLFDAHGAECLLPLVSRDEVVGLLAIGALAGGRGLRPEELRLLVRLQEHCAGLVVYATMYRETNTRVEMAKEVELAAAVQEAFLPRGDTHSLGAVSLSGFYAPASRCGGDWWSVHELPRDRVLVLIGDVTGHGVAAAMVTAAAKGCYDVAQRLMGDKIELERLLALLDGAVRHAGGDRFHMTCFATLLDPPAATITYANAGHVMPYLCRRSDDGEQHLEVLLARGNPLGSPSRGHHRSHARPLRPGDLLVWYTDGLVECTDRDRQPYGDRRFQRALRRLAATAGEPAALRDELVRDAALFQDGHPADDDVTLVVARVKRSARRR